MEKKENPMQKKCMLMLGSVLLLASSSLWSQTFYGSIAGSVLDESGAAVPDATVTLTNIGTAEKRTMNSDPTGSYQFLNLVPGRYRVESEKSGFKHFDRQPIVVEVNTTLRIDIPMVLGTVSQTIEVTSQTPLLSTATSDLGQVVSSRTVTEMPLNGRNPIALVGLVPGVVPQGPPSAGNSSMGNPVGANPFAMGAFQVGGGQAGQSAILLDGVPTNGSYLNVVTLIPTQDAIQEFKVQTNNQGPEFGRTGGGIINFTTKSGTNSFHGSAYEFLRNKVLDANDFFLNAGGVKVPPFTQNQFGGNIGGPVVRDKLFFFGAYEGYRLRKGAAFTSTVPTPAERTGDFSNFKDSNGNLIPIYDALTTCGVSGNPACAKDASGNPIYTRQPFANNQIPAGRIDPTAAVLMGYFPTPTGTGTGPTNINNFTKSYSTGGNIDQANARVDYSLSDRQRVFGRFTYFNLLNLADSPFNQICTDRCTETVHTKQIALGDTITLSPTTILDLHLGYTRYAYLRTPLSKGIDLSKFGPNWGALNHQVGYTHIPTVCISENQGDNLWGGGWCSAGTGSGIGAHDDTWSFAPSLSKIKGAHSLRVGWEFRVLRNNYYQTNQPSGLLQFDNIMTEQNPLTRPPCSATSCSGNGIASFLLGYGNNNNSNVTTPSFMASQIIYNAFYAGDTFQVTRKLTLNLGVRWDLQGNWTERFDRIVDFLPHATSPLSSAMASVINPVSGKPFGTLNGAFALVNSSQRSSRTAVDMPWTNFSPRIGLAYRYNDKTVIRSGYGIFYLPVDIAWNNAPHNLFINTYQQPWLASINNEITPNNVLSNPFPPPTAIIQPAGRNQAWINQQGSGVSAPVTTNPYAYVQQWNFDIQRELPDGTLIDVACAGSKGTHLPMHSQDLNQLTAANLPAPDGSAGPNGYTAAQLTASVPNPFYGLGLITSGNLTAPTVTAAHLLYPYPQYDDVSMAEPNNRDSIYHSMQLKVERRFKQGGTFLASYTISKLISDTNNEINWLGDAAPGWGDSNAYNLRNERSLDGFDVPQRFVFSLIQDLPIGKGKKYANNLSPVASKFVSGWGVNGIVTLQSGFPLSIGGAGKLGSIPNAGGPRATRTGNDSLTSGPLSARLNKWFDTSVFSPTNDYTYGNDSRTEPNLRGDGQKNFDFALFKNTKFGPDEKLGLEFRAEFFNLFNRPMFSAPNTGCCGSSFGVVTSQYNLPRIIQFGLRFTF
jgi:hypothetical protein